MIVSTNIAKYDIVENIPVEFTVFIDSVDSTDYKLNLLFNDFTKIKSILYYDSEKGWTYLVSSIDLKENTDQVKFRVTFLSSGDYSLSTYITSNGTEIANCSNEFYVRDYVPVSVSSSLPEKIEIGKEYDFDIIVNSFDDAGKEVFSKIDFNLACILERYHNDEWIEEKSNTLFILKNENIHYRVKFTELGSAEMSYSLYENNSEITSLKETVFVTEKEILKPEISIEVDKTSTSDIVEIFVHVIANEYKNKLAIIKYIFSVSENIKHLEQYISDESSKYYGRWLTIDPSNLYSGEVRLLKDETIQFRVSFFNKNKDTSFIVCIDNEKYASYNDKTDDDDSGTDLPVEPVDLVQIECIQKPEGSTVIIDDKNGFIKFFYQSDISSDFWKDYYAKHNVNKSVYAYVGLRWIAPKMASSWRMITQSLSDETIDSGIVKFENEERFLDWYFPVAKSDNPADPLLGEFKVFSNNNTGIYYKQNVIFYKD